MKFIGILKRKILKYLIKIWRIFQRILILIKIKEINFFMIKQE